MIGFTSSTLHWESVNEMVIREGQGKGQGREREGKGREGKGRGEKGGDIGERWRWWWTWRQMRGKDVALRTILLKSEKEWV